MPAPLLSSEIIRCPLCGGAVAPDDRFCEFDGTPLVDDPAFEVLGDTPDLAAATHRGRAHQVDQDACAVGRRQPNGLPLHALVVCDGVSSSSHGERASGRAAKAALDVLLSAADTPGPLDPKGALRQAVRAAHRAACAPDIDPEPGKTPPGTTLVAALAHRGMVDVAWVGDSRAYVVRPTPCGAGQAPANLLTHDHSWLNEVVDSGELTEADAIRSPSAHALTHCIGPLENPDPEQPAEPSLASATDLAGSRLVLCTDGLWNVVASPAEIAAMASAPPATVEARALAIHLVRRAFASGGLDDVTAAVAFL